jgi:hypothetical protein
MEHIEGRAQSVPRAVASVTASRARFRRPRSLLLAVLIYPFSLSSFHPWIRVEGWAA